MRIPLWITRYGKTLALILLIIAVVSVAVSTRGRWVPMANELISKFSGAPSADDETDHSHDAQDSPDDQIDLSTIEQRNIGLQSGTVSLGEFVKTAAIPAIITERPGRTQFQVTAPFTGTVIEIHVAVGQLIESGQPLFELRLTHEDLVTAQKEFLESAQELDVIEDEIKRLQSIREGVIPERRILEQQYEQRKVRAKLLAQKQGLLLHGISEEQVDTILESRELIKSLTIRAPEHFAEEDQHEALQHRFHVQVINVLQGQHVTAGTTMAVLADHCLLYVEGHAFEDDLRRLHLAEERGWSITLTQPGENEPLATDLKVHYVADHIDPDSRTLPFYLFLANDLLGQMPVKVPSEHDQVQFASWKYRPGQRMQVHVPLQDPLVDQIVLPSAAVVEEGASTFVFVQTINRFRKFPVHILDRDRNHVIVERDDELVGKTIALDGAYQIHLAIKKKTQSGAGGHHGHVH